MHTLPSVRSDEAFLDRLIELRATEDIPKEWHGTPIESFIMSQNFGWPIQTTGKPELLISTCIEFRYAMPVPRMYAYVIRRASGRVIGSEFSVAYTLAKGIKSMIMIGHNDCGMARVEENTPNVIDALVDQGWSRTAAEEYCAKHGERYAIEDELDSLRTEYLRIRKIFRKLTIAPLFVCLYDTRLYLPKWWHELEKSERKPPGGMVPDEEIKALP